MPKIPKYISIGAILLLFCCKQLKVYGKTSSCHHGWIVPIITKKYAMYLGNRLKQELQKMQCTSNLLQHVGSDWTLYVSQTYDMNKKYTTHILFYVVHMNIR